MLNRSIYLFSFLRSIAVFLIFLHHYCKTVFLLNQYTLAPVLAIAIFVFVSGFLSRRKIVDPFRWIVKRIFRILLPYWILFNLLVVMNLVLGFRPYDYSNYFFELLGLQLFVRPFYEATWFISYILILYFIVFVVSFFRYHIFLLLIFSILSAFFISKFTVLPFVTFSRLIFWQVFFVFGYLLAGFGVVDLVEKFYVSICSSYFCEFFNSFNAIVYYFYLLHGPFLFFFFDVLRVGPEFSFVLSFIFTILCSLLFKKVDVFVRLWLENKLF